jgi:hypothetical protein
MVRLAYFLMMFTFSVNADMLKNATTAVIIADWGTTLDIERHDNLCETNRLMGRNPTRGTVNKYFIGKLLLHFYINSLKSKRIRNAWNVTQFYITATAVRGNLQAGLQIRF